MAISIDAVEKITTEGRSFTILSNNRTNTGAGILNAPIMPLPTLLLGLFGTPAVFTLRCSDSYDPVSGQCTSTATRTISCQIYLDEETIENSDGTGQNEAVARVYAPGEAFGYATTALLTLQVMETGQNQRKVELP